MTFHIKQYRSYTVISCKALVGLWVGSLSLPQMVSRLKILFWSKVGFWLISSFDIFNHFGKLIFLISNHRKISTPWAFPSWKHKIQENNFELGWQGNIARQVQVEGIRRHMSAELLKDPLAPSNLRKASSITNKDCRIWGDAYDEEYNGLNDLDTFTKISDVEYQCSLKNIQRWRCSDPNNAITNICTVKKDKENNPVQAKSRIMVLRNHKKRIWTREDKCTPVLSAASTRLLISMAVQDRRCLKQGDYKNAFCKPKLPEDKMCIVKPHMGCTNSKKGTYWKLNKTLYGLVRSAHHWYTKIS